MPQIVKELKIKLLKLLNLKTNTLSSERAISGDGLDGTDQHHRKSCRPGERSQPQLQYESLERIRIRSQ